MHVLFNKTVFELDENVNLYLVYLAHIQQSVNLSTYEKIDAFNKAESIANDIYALTAKLLSLKVNDFNQDDIFKFIDKNAKPIIQAIHNELESYDQKLSIKEKMLYSVKDAIQFLIHDKNAAITFTIDKMNRLLSYQKLFVDEEEKIKNEKLKNSLEDTKKKENKALEALKLKTFKEMIRGKNHKNEDYFFKTNSYVIQNFYEDLQFEKLEHTDRQGCFFVIENDIHIKITKSDLQIDYKIQINKSDPNSNITVSGFIKHDQSKVEFYIDESFNSQLLNSYLNAFNITPIIKKWNECYLKYYVQEETNILDDSMAKKHIDDLFEGKIM